MSSPDLVVLSERIVTPEAVVPGAVVIRDGRIEEIARYSSVPATTTRAALADKRAAASGQCAVDVRGRLVYRRGQEVEPRHGRLLHRGMP